MAIATITSKGQVTIPQSVRQSLKLRAGDKLDFRIEESGVVRVYPIAKRAVEVSGHFSYKASRARSTAEIKSELRKAFRDRRT